MDNQEIKALLPIEEQGAKQLVNARMLHEFLGVKTRFRDWLPRRIIDGSFIEDRDYVIHRSNLSGTSELKKDYGLTMRMAEHICMMERTQKGEEARDYFIECERQARSMVPRIPTHSEALRLAADYLDRAEGAEKKLAIAAPKVESFDKYIDATGTMSMNVAGKILGVGQNKLFEFLRDQRVLMNYPNIGKRKNSKRDWHNVPYQKYVDLGWFSVSPGTYNRKGKSGKKYGKSHTTKVTTKGLDGISRMLARKAEQPDMFHGQ